MRKLVGGLLLCGAAAAALMTLLALCLVFGSIAASSYSASLADTLSKASGALFALSRIGVIVAVVCAAIYAGFWIDFSGAAETKTATPRDTENPNVNSLD